MGSGAGFINDRGETISLRSVEPVEVLGLRAPLADDFVVVEDEARAREVTEYRQRAERQKSLSGAALRADVRSD